MIHLGGHAVGSGQGIAVISLRDGVPGLQSTAECPTSRAYLAAAPGGRALYAAHELDEGLVSAFAVGARGDLRLLGTQPSGEAQPCHLSVHPSGRYVLSAHWGSGASRCIRSSAVGSSVRPPSWWRTRSRMPAWWSPTPGGWVHAVHLGAGTISTYGLDPGTGRLGLRGEVALHRGAGPRHLAFHPRGTSV